MSEIVKDEISRILDSHICGCLSTQGCNDGVYCNTVYYAFDSEYNLYFASDCNTKHSLNIAQNTNVAMCIWDEPQAYGKEHIGLQIVGHCNQISGKELFHAWILYTKRFNVFQQKIGSFENLRDKLSGIRLYKINPTIIKVTNTALLGSRPEVYAPQIV